MTKNNCSSIGIVKGDRILSDTTFLVIMALIVVTVSLLRSAHKDFESAIDGWCVAIDKYENLLEKHTDLIRYLRGEKPMNLDKLESQKRFKESVFKLLATLDPGSKWEVLSPIESSRLAMYPVGGYAIFKDDRRVGMVREGGNEVGEVLDLYQSLKAQ
jgi:hypothetical protein